MGGFTCIYLLMLKSNEPIGGEKEKDGEDSSGS